MSESDLALPFPANRTSQGPKTSFERGSLLVEYDYENDDGQPRWAKVMFTETLFFQFADSSCFEEVIEFDRIRRLKKSSLLVNVMARWNESVGWHKWQQDRGGAARFSHFTVFFDDAGSLDVIASDCKVLDR